MKWLGAGMKKMNPITANPGRESNSSSCEGSKKIRSGWKTFTLLLKPPKLRLMALIIASMFGTLVWQFGRRFLALSLAWPVRSWRDG